MCNISSTGRSNSQSPSPWEDRDIAKSFTGKDFYQELIRKANSVSIVDVIKLYNIKIGSHNNKIVCPFKSHRSGRESTPSFTYYDHTNSFWCFGCNTGTRTTDFVSKMDECSKVEAAYKILKLFEPSFDSNDDFDYQSNLDKIEIMMDFSKTILNFRQMHFDKKSEQFIEHICWLYDELNAKHKLDNNALQSIVEQFKKRINFYSPDHNLVF